MSGRQPHGRTIRQDLKHSLPSYTNINLFRDCATEQSQAAREDELKPPGTAGSARSDSARRALKLSLAAGSASLCVSSQPRRGCAAVLSPSRPASPKRRPLFFFFAACLCKTHAHRVCAPLSAATRMCGRASRHGSAPSWSEAVR